MQHSFLGTRSATTNQGIHGPSGGILCRENWNAYVNINFGIMYFHSDPVAKFSESFRRLAKRVVAR